MYDCRVIARCGVPLTVIEYSLVQSDRVDLSSLYLSEDIILYQLFSFEELLVWSVIYHAPPLIPRSILALLY